MRKYAVIAAALMMSSCATPEKWEAQTATPTPLEAARASCRQAAEQRYPVSLSLHASSPAFSSMTINGTEIPQRRWRRLSLGQQCNAQNRTR
ncbi:hypothetical protein ACTPT9_004325 [Serratia marcescens]|uniref:hypothetical protein n=1 Tax=Serratia marcescens TaxID=615 RepID=UPI0027946815|nr:hypothetical protein [Serratia marcescens]ELD1858453.1 hypothetical protein [Serratia marcescens]ELM0005222.1 hypothetical protein [Serratia marcescens]MDP8027805.1 hypothetical protein [Serratia marcescens]HBH7558600.1 hypothetical protein [Serratia marcescens]HEJ0021704.1 hypothetical protein [Serratia marcescens]